MMKRKRRWFVVAGVILLVALSVVLVLYSKNKKDTPTISKVQQYVKYDVEKAYELALSELENNCDRASILTDVKTLDYVMSLNFVGLSDSKTNNEIVDLLSSYDSKATFFISGIVAAEDSDLLQRLDKEGHDMGSNGLNGDAYMEKLPSKELVNSFVRTNGIINTYIDQKESTLLYCSATEYTDQVLQAAYASGNEQVVKSNYVVNYGSFTSYEQVKGYIHKLPRGAILTVKLEGELEEIEYQPSVTEEDPAKDMQAGIEESEVLEGTKEEKLVKITEWILRAIQEERIENVLCKDLSAYYDASLEKDYSNVLQKVGVPAKAYQSIPNKPGKVGFVFRGISDEGELKTALTFLKEQDYRATFFVTGDEVIRYPERITEIVASGHEIGNGGMTGKDVTTMNPQEAYFEIMKCDELLKEQLGDTVKIFMPGYGKYNKTTEQVAGLLKYTIVTYNKYPIASKEVSVEQVDEYFNSPLKSGDIIYIPFGVSMQFKEILSTLAKKVEEGNRAVDTVSILLQNIVLQTEEQTVTTTIATSKNQTKKPVKDSTITVVDKKKEKEEREKEKAEKEKEKEKEKKQKEEEAIVKEANKLRKQNKGQVSKVNRLVHTTDLVVGYSFSGVSRGDVVDKVLAKLKGLNIHATFFVSMKDIQNSKKTIDKIVKEGHELQILLLDSNGRTYTEVATTILKIKDFIDETYQQNANLVRYAYDVDYEKEVLEAISATNCQVIGQSVSVAISKVEKDASADEILEVISHQGHLVATRGYIAHFRMDYYENPTVIAKVLEMIKEEKVDTIGYLDEGIKKNGYQFETLSEIVSGKGVYQYPLTKSTILDATKGKIGKGRLASENIFEYIAKRYVGNNSIKTIAALPGFTEEEIEKIDKTGRFTSDKVLFLSFDDWGSDAAITKLLYVLNKYNVKATFFIRTNYVLENPNLLRAIALNGHDIASHTNSHMVLANSTDQPGVYSNLDDKQAEELQDDFIKSYDILQSIIGDLQIDNRPSLQTFMRPPTLAVSKKGLEAIFDAGASLVISGDFSTHDYEAKSVSEVVETMKNGIVESKDKKSLIQNGSIIVMHMSDNAKYTAEALDIVIPYYLSQGYHFARISDYLGNGELISSKEQR